MKKVLGTILALFLVITLAACGSDSASSSTEASTAPASESTVASAEESTAPAEKTIVKVGVVGENNEQWKAVNENLAKDNIEVELVTFSEYKIPNLALQDGDIDLNAFQHLAYLNAEKEDLGYKLSPIGTTLIAPLGIFSSNITSLDQVKEGDSVAIPNDATNGGRALKLIEAQGFIKLDPSKGYLATTADITENTYNLDITEVEASMVPSLLPDVTFGIINGGHAVDAGLSLRDDALAIESTDVNSSEDIDNPYINIIVARDEDVDNPVYKKVVEAYHQDNVKKVIEEYYKGAYVPVW